MEYTKMACKCGCGRPLMAGQTNWATPACVLRSMMNDPALVDVFGGVEAFEAAIASLEARTLAEMVDPPTEDGT